MGYLILGFEYYPQHISHIIHDIEEVWIKVAEEWRRHSL